MALIFSSCSRRASSSAARALATAFSRRSRSFSLAASSTNAAKYGSLSTPSGRVDIGWETDDAEALVLRWSERDGPRVKEPTRKGFGVGAVDSVIRTLRGRIARQWRPEGLSCELSFPEITA